MFVRDVLVPSLARGLVVGLALVGPGLLLHATSGMFSTSVAAREVVFDVALGLLVVAPAAAVEGLAAVRRLPRVAAVPITFVVACAGATGASLQGLYADAVLHTGSLDAGLAEVTRGAGALPRLKDLLALFAGIALVTTVHVQSRLVRPPRTWQQQVASCTGAAVTAFLLLTFTPVPRPALRISGFMLLALALLLPPLAQVVETQAARLRPPAA